MLSDENGYRIRPGSLYRAALCFSALLFALALLLVSPSGLLPGLAAILCAEGALITDYMALAGPGAAFLNSALVVLASLLVFRLAGAELCGSHVFVLGFMSGFALFGKNIFNLWPFVLGSFLYSRRKGEPFAGYCNMGLLSSCLGPVVSFLCRSGGPLRFLLALLLGIFIGFAVCPLSAATFRMLKGLNLYNGGFACGLIAYAAVPLLTALGMIPTGGTLWATGLNRPLGLFLAGLCLFLLIAGLSQKGSCQEYRRLLRDPGRSPRDFLQIYGPGAVLLNMGATGLLSAGCILALGGDLNGPTVGSVFTVMGFSAYGKHPRNILPVMSGVALGAALLPRLSLTAPPVQMALLLGTTLAPMAGVYGWPVGVLAGVLHICLVLRTGSPVNGLNLYNNGFSGGLVSLLLSSVLPAFLPERAIAGNREE